MDGTVISLRNQSKTVCSAEEALDFNFNDSLNLNHDAGTIDDLGIPFLHNMNRPLLPGDLILIEGIVMKNAVSFRIDFCSNNNDIVLHINPRLDQNYIARNSCIEEKWGHEEGVAVTRSPISRGSVFQFQVFVLEKEFMRPFAPFEWACVCGQFGTSFDFLVCVNGQHMFQYSHRVSPLDISRIEIYGDIELSNVALMRSVVYPHPARDKFSRPESNLDVPYTRYIKHGLGTCGKILFKAKVKLLPVSFYINIQSNNLVYPHPKVVYHLNARYSSDACILQNSWGLRGNGWDEEFRSPLPLALSPGSVFTLSITSNNAYIQARGPDWDLPPFYHRLNPDVGLYIYVQGDIVLHSVQLFPDNDTESVI